MCGVDQCSYESTSKMEPDCEKDESCTKSNDSIMDCSCDGQRKKYEHGEAQE